METIKIKDIRVTEYQRSTLQYTVDIIADSINDHGYNDAYPIILDSKEFLIDGGHRIAAAKKCGLIKLPYLTKPDNDTSNLQYAMQCNDDRGRGRADDVFDKAEYCWKLANVGEMTGDQIAGVMGWDRTKVLQYSSIKDKLHPDTWDSARMGVTNNQDLVTQDAPNIVTQDVTKVTVNWRETHFRAFLKHLPCPDPTDTTARDAQLKVIEAVYANPTKLSAKWIDKQATRYAWYITLEAIVKSDLIPEVDPIERKKLIKSIKDSTYGDKPDDKNLKKLEFAIFANNENILGIKLYQDNAFQFIPTLDDKSIALVATDIPYNTTKNEWDNIGTDQEYMKWIRDWLNILKPKLCNDYHLFFCVAPEYMARIENILVEDSWPIKSRIIWEYRNLVKGRDVTDKFISNWQMIFHIGTHNLNWSKDWNDERFTVQNWACPQTNFNDKKLHPTSKPLGLFELFIKIGSKPGDIVLDPFAGGGTTGEASKNIGQRQCILIEQNKDYCKVIEKRLNVKCK